MANCRTCAGPLPSGSTVCVYCGARNEVDLQGVHEYTLRAPESPRTCPNCAVALRTIDIRADRKFLIEQCGSCNGLFFDPNEIEALLAETVKHAYTIDYERIKTLAAEKPPCDQMRYRPCPVCGELMHRSAFGLRSGVIIDRCARHGVWLDGGELRRLMEWRKAGGQLLHEKRKAEREAQDRRARVSGTPILPVSLGEPKTDGLTDVTDALAFVWSFIKRCV